MAPGSESDDMQAVVGKKILILRCMFCGRRVGDKEYHSANRIYPPGRSTFGLKIVCPRCKQATTY